MRTKVVLLISIVAGVAAASATWRLSQPSSLADYDLVLPADVKRVLETGDRFVLLTLDPKEPDTFAEGSPLPTDEDTFHGYHILGQTQIKKERTELLLALYKGIAESDGTAAACFIPRHGISATAEGETVDLVICFQCLSLQIHSKNAHGKSVLLTSSPQPTFQRVAQKGGLKTAN